MITMLHEGGGMPKWLQYYMGLCWGPPTAIKWFMDPPSGIVYWTMIEIATYNGGGKYEEIGFVEENTKKNAGTPQ